MSGVTGNGSSFRYQAPAHVEVEVEEGTILPLAFQFSKRQRETHDVQMDSIDEIPLLQRVQSSLLVKMCVTSRGNKSKLLPFHSFHSCCTPPFPLPICSVPVRSSHYNRAVRGCLVNRGLLEGDFQTYKYQELHRYLPPRTMEATLCTD